MSVSYTHLDVYKRQNTDTANEIEILQVRGNSNNFLREGMLHPRSEETS